MLSGFFVSGDQKTVLIPFGPQGSPFRDFRFTVYYKKTAHGKGIVAPFAVRRYASVDPPA